MALNNNNNLTEIDLLLDGLENETDFSDIPVDAELLKLAEELTTPDVKPIEEFKPDAKLISEQLNVATEPWTAPVNIQQKLVEFLNLVPFLSEEQKRIVFEAVKPMVMFFI